ncbi:hypothetical protein KY289_031036 [Solanum tuberosum]|nr:hypothetical protein KY284_031777 [Solanum tuberosum]KAH0653358.1 hypothetical protein KY289_031036 [Solanum tuberosum]
MNRRRDDMMNFDEIPHQVHRTYKQVYLTVFCAMLSSTFGSIMAWISVAGGKFTVLSYVASLFWIYAITTRERSKIYIGCLPYCLVLMISGISFILLDGHTALWMMTILFMGYLVIYSQEILYDANFGDINFVNCTFTVLLHLPGIVVHAARLYLQGAEIEQH